MIYNSILDLIGHTPLVRINKITESEDAEILVKLEKLNVGGSVKDRLGLYLIMDAEKKYPDIKDRTIIEATSGSTGIALSMIGAMKGYKITIVMPAGVSEERRKIIKAYGAELILSPADQGTGGSIALKKEMIAKNPEKYIAVDQHENPANIAAHFETTAEEIWQDTEGRIDMVVIAVGTAGTGIGISRKLKAYNPEIKIIGVTPRLGASIQGLRNPREANGSKLFDEKYFDEMIELSSDEIPLTYEFSRRLAREEGILAGMSAGAAMYVAVCKAKELGKGKRIVTLLADSGERYLSTELFGG
ncbi:MAG: PLP-dependent cysteine synthase family protein [Candidatus Pacebacteria bacterium]|nr:PLP-dependent cysteine synthase family protein [Candidatus Paceibacterota bacterium]